MDVRLTARSTRHRPRWREWRTAEGGCLIDLQALYEARLVQRGALSGEDPGLTRAAARFSPRRFRSATRARDSLVTHLVDLIEAGIDACPHGAPLWIDLSSRKGRADWLPEGFFCGPIFGSGGMAWTRAALRAIDAVDVRGATVADIGTGTGILGFHALSRGAAHVHAIDSDALARAVAGMNARLLGESERFTVHASVGDLTPSIRCVLVHLWGVWDLPPILPPLVESLPLGASLILAPLEGTGELAQIEVICRDLRLASIRASECEGWFALEVRVTEAGRPSTSDSPVESR